MLVAGVGGGCGVKWPHETNPPARSANTKKRKPMQCIHTKFLPCGNVRGSRIKATCDRGSITIPYPHELSGDEVHREAVRRLVAKFAAEDLKTYGTPIAENPWCREFVTGGLPGDNGMAHVFTR